MEPEKQIRFQIVNRYYYNDKELDLLCFWMFAPQVS